MVKRFALVAAVLSGFLLGTLTIIQHGADQRSDVLYAQLMGVHHGQAVEMALTEMNAGNDPELILIATDSLLTQQNQVGRFQQFLAERSAPVAAGEAHAMPGMATPEEMSQLRGSSGVETDRLFIELMIRHHQGGVRMSEEMLDGLDGQMKRLAVSVIASQQSEIDRLQELAATLPLANTP